MSTESHNAKVLRRLLSGKSLTSLQAIRWWGCTRLSGRINDLRKRGYDIHTELVPKGGSRYARYTMKEGA